MKINQFASRSESLSSLSESGVVSTPKLYNPKGENSDPASALLPPQIDREALDALDTALATADPAAVERTLASLRETPQTRR